MSTMNKIQALEKTIYNLENDVVHYFWMSYETCNCGVLAHSIMGNDADFSDRHKYDNATIMGGFSGTFNNAVIHCSITGLPLQKVFKSLLDCGFNYDELHELEAESGFLSGNTGDRGDRQLRKAGWYDGWPWDSQWDKREKHDYRRSLIIAGALIAAERTRE